MDDESHNNKNKDRVEKKDDSGKTDDLPKNEGLHKKKAKAKKNGLAKKEFSKKLRSVRRARNRLVVCFLTLPVYIYAVYALLENGRSIDGFMYLYMVIYLAFGAHMAMKRCPNCNNQFYVKLVLLNLFTSRCVHCKQSYKYTGH